MLIAPNEDGFRGRHLRLLSDTSMDSSTMKNRKDWSQETGPDHIQHAESLSLDTPLLTTYPHASVLRLRVVQIVCGISAMVMGTVGFIEERGRLNLGLGIPAGAATVLAAAVSIHCGRSFAGPSAGLGGSVGGSCCPRWCGGAGGGAGGGSGGGVRWRLRRLGPLAGCWIAACLLHTALLVAASTAFVAQFRYSADERNRDIVIVSLVQLTLSLGTMAAEAALVTIECRRWPVKGD